MKFPSNFEFHPPIHGCNYVSRFSRLSRAENQRQVPSNRFSRMSRRCRATCIVSNIVRTSIFLLTAALSTERLLETSRPRSPLPLAAVWSERMLLGWQEIAGRQKMQKFLGNSFCAVQPTSTFLSSTCAGDFDSRFRAGSDTGCYYCQWRRRSCFDLLDTIDESVFLRKVGNINVAMISSDFNSPFRKSNPPFR